MRILAILGIPVIALGLLSVPTLAVASPAAERSAAIEATPGASAVSCTAFAVTGDPRSSTGAAWTYRSIDGGVLYSLEGVLFVPATGTTFPAVVVSHGKGGTPRAYSANIARIMAGWGLVVIATMYTHAPDAEDQGNAPDGADGASTANVLRANKTRELLGYVAGVDPGRVAAHGHSMGAFVTGQTLGTFPTAFRAASHTAGGVSDGPNATKPAAAQRIVTPYQLHHGDADQVVSIALDRTLDRILTANGVTHQFHVYAGYDHGRIAADSLMLSRVRAWYRAHGVLT